MLLKELVIWEELDGAMHLLTQFVESFRSLFRLPCMKAIKNRADAEAVPHCL